MTEHVLVLRVSCSQYHNLYRILAELVHHIINQVKSFLVCQTGYNTDHHHMGILIQPKFFLKSQFVHRLQLPEIINCEILCDPAVSLRIPVRIVQSVDNTAKIIGPCIHQAVQRFTVKRSLNLLSISLAHRCHLVRIDDTALQKVGVFISFHLIRNKIILRKSGDSPYRLRIPYALELQVMYRHDGLDPAVIFTCIPEIVQINRNQSCLPVMAMYQIRPETDHRKNT